MPSYQGKSKEFTRFDRFFYFRLLQIRERLTQHKKQLAEKVLPVKMRNVPDSLLELGDYNKVILI